MAAPLPVMSSRDPRRGRAGGSTCRAQRRKRSSPGSCGHTCRCGRNGGRPSAFEQWPPHRWSSGSRWPQDLRGSPSAATIAATVTAKSVADRFATGARQRPGRVGGDRRGARIRFPLERRGRQLARGAGTGGGGGGHHALELPAAPGGGQSGPRPGRGVHRGVEAQRDRPAHRAALRQRPRRGGRPGRRVQPRARHRPGGRRGLAAHPDVDMVSFTGSTRAGRRVSEVASQTIKRVALELGGKSANIILDDADLQSGQARGRRVLLQRRPERNALEPDAGASPTTSRRWNWPLRRWPYNVGYPRREPVGPGVNRAADRVVGYIHKGIEEARSWSPVDRSVRGDRARSTS